MKKRKKKILVLAHSASVGGAELALKSLIESTSNTYEWSVIYPTSKKPMDFIKINGVKKNYFIPLPWWCYEGDSNIAYNKQLLKLSLHRLTALAKKHDYLLTNTITIPWLALANIKIKKPHIWYVHEYGNLDHKLNFIIGYDQSLNFISETSSTVMTISDNLMRHLAKVIDKKKIKIIHQSINIDKFTSIEKKKLPEKLSEVIIMSIAAIKPSKGQDLLVDAVCQIRKSGVAPPKVTIIGPVADRDFFDSLCDKAKNISQIQIIESFVNTEDYIKNSDVIFVGSENEALGRATLEGLASSRLVIGTRAGATESLLSDFRGVMFEKNNTNELVKIIYSLPKLLMNHDYSVAKNFVTNNYNETVQSSDFDCIISKAKKSINSFEVSELNLTSKYEDLSASLLVKNYLKKFWKK